MRGEGNERGREGRERENGRGREREGDEGGGEGGRERGSGVKGEGDRGGEGKMVVKDNDHFCIKHSLVSKTH